MTIFILMYWTKVRRFYLLINSVKIKNGKSIVGQKKYGYKSTTFIR